MNIDNNDQCIFNIIDLVTIILSYCDIVEKINFHRINKTCNNLMIKCYFCNKEPILPILLLPFTKNYLHLNQVSCFECYDQCKSKDTNISCFKNIDENDKKLWKNLDKLNMISIKSKNGSELYHKKCYVKCNKCNMRCFDSTWLYHHKINCCYKSTRIKSTYNYNFDVFGIRPIWY